MSKLYTLIRSKMKNMDCYLEIDLFNMILSNESILNLIQHLTYPTNKHFPIDFFVSGD